MWCIHIMEDYSATERTEVLTTLQHGWNLAIICCVVKSLSRVRLFATPWTVAYQAPPSMGFSRQKYWSGVPFPSPNNMLSEKKKSHKRSHYMILCEIPTTGKSTEKECTWMIAYQQLGRKKRWTESEYLMNLTLLFEVMKMFGN